MSPNNWPDRCCRLGLSEYCGRHCADRAQAGVSWAFRKMHKESRPVCLSSIWEIIFLRRNHQRNLAATPQVASIPLAAESRFRQAASRTEMIAVAPAEVLARGEPIRSNPPVRYRATEMCQMKHQPSRRSRMSNGLDCRVVHRDCIPQALPMRKCWRADGDAGLHRPATPIPQPAPVRCSTGPTLTLAASGPRMRGSSSHHRRTRIARYGRPRRILYRGSRWLFAQRRYRQRHPRPARIASAPYRRRIPDRRFDLWGSFVRS